MCPERVLVALAAVLLAGGAAHADDEPVAQGVVLGVTAGACRVDGPSSETYDRGWGKGLIAGYQTGVVTFELALFESYDLRVREAAYDGAGTGGRVGLSAFGGAGRSCRTPASTVASRG